MQDITKYFKKAGLDLILTNKPIIRSLTTGAQDVFQMTILNGRPEKFQIFRGKGNDVRVLDYNSKKEQVLLYVKEPKRTFVESRYDIRQGKKINTTHETPEGIRRYLVGMDERHLFISELPKRHGKINKVDDAFRILKPYEIKDRKKRKKAKVIRQGEWFFVEATPEELQIIQDNLNLIEHKEPLGTRGKPHIADEVLRIGDKITEEILRNKSKVFIRGKVRHADHKTKTFFTWHRVFGNTERATNNTIGWVD